MKLTETKTRTKKTQHQKDIKALDTLVSEYIRKRAMQRVGGCEKCLRPKFDIQKDNAEIYPAWKQLEWCHFIGRKRFSVRWDEDNSAGLCGGCHRFLDSQSLEKDAWFQHYLGDVAFICLQHRMRDHSKPDIEALTLYYQERIKEAE